MSLLDDAKNYLDRTWGDDDFDKKLEGILQRGQNYLNIAAGTLLDYGKQGAPRALLFDYARYALNNALDEFEKNYNDQILKLNIITNTAEGGIADTYVATDSEVDELITDILARKGNA